MYTANEANVILRVCNGDEHDKEARSDLINQGLVYLDPCGNACPSTKTLALMGIAINKRVNIDPHGGVSVMTEAARTAGEE